MINWGMMINLVWHSLTLRRINMPYGADCKVPAVLYSHSINHNKPAEELTNVFQQALTHK